MRSNEKNDTFSSSNIQLYSYQQTYKDYNEKSTEYKFIVISDMDKTSMVGQYKWKGVIKEGILRFKNDEYEIRWVNEVINYPPNYINIYYIKLNLLINIDKYFHRV